MAGGKWQQRGRGRGPRGPQSKSQPDVLIPLPRVTAGKLERVRDRRSVQNVGLWLDKFGWVDGQDEYSFRGQVRLQALRAYEGLHHSKAAAEVLERWARWPDAAKAAQVRGGLVAARFEMKTLGHLLVDYGRASASESSLSFHWVYGCPRIPGSALRGVARANLGDLDLEPCCGREPLTDTPGMAGKVTFLDALPVGGRFSLGMDVLTPHYQGYYQQDLDSGSVKQPNDWQSPVPHTFLTVVDTTFRFTLLASWREADLLQRVAETLKTALSDWGAGAKKSAGYGRLEPVDRS